MPVLDLVVRGGSIVRSSGVEISDLGISNGKIVEMAPEIRSSAAEEWDARGLHLFPGVIDVHVHFNEPGREDWEGIASGSRAFAAGGGTLFFDMPLNSSPVTTNAAGFAAKLERMREKSVTDFALWGGLTPQNLSSLEELAQCGVIGFKAFMSNSGLEEFNHVDDWTLLEGMKTAARLGLPVAVHAESDPLTSALGVRARAQGRTSIRDYLESRPVLAELEAVSRACLFAGETGCKLHLVHLSSGRAVVLASEFRARGVDVTLETCPHYLCFTDEDLERLGAVLKCAPPVRNRAEQDFLWANLEHLDLIGSDHSPAPPNMKTSSDFFAIWGGISGVQSTLECLLTEGFHQRGVALEQIAHLLSGGPAERFGLKERGQLESGFQADLALVDLNKKWTLEREDLLYRHPQSPYVGRTFHGKVVRTLARGKTIFQEGLGVLEARGKWVSG
jgi:allantoinase